MYNRWRPTASHWREDRMIFTLEVWAPLLGVALVLGSPILLIAAYLQTRKRAEEERQMRERLRRGRAVAERLSQEYAAQQREIDEHYRAQATARKQQSETRTHQLEQCRAEAECITGERDPDKRRKMLEAWLERWYEGENGKADTAQDTDTH